MKDVVKGKREALANLCHEQWSEWMRYLFSKSIIDWDNLTCTIPKESFVRWLRQTATPYAKLSKEEQESDLKEADKFIELLREEEVPNRIE